MASKNNILWLMGAALGVVGVPMSVAAQTQDQQAEEITTSAEIVVVGKITYRDRTEATAPVLEYGLDYFQRFEPLTAGDALKRVPGVAFVGTDILESDQAQLRGLGAGYTQILVNGEQVPGSGDDRTFLLDRIPAELIERVEIIRSPSASRSGDAVAGALNIVLRDSYALEGGFVRAGSILFPDDEIGFVLGGVYGGQVGPGRLLVGANMQDRRNPKEKLSLRFEPDDGVLEFDNREDQIDTRDGTDYSFNANYIVDVLGGELDLGAFYVRTDRLEDEQSREYDDETSTAVGNLLTLNDNEETIVQDNYTLNGRYKRDLFGGQFKARIGYSEFKDDLDEFEIETAYEDAGVDDDETEGERVLTDRTDKELVAKLAQEFETAGGLKVEFGVDYKKKDRDTNALVSEVFALGARALPAFGTELEEEEEIDGDDETVREASEFEPFAGSIYTIEETRIDPYFQVNGDLGDRTSWELGLRYETTKVDVNVDEDAVGDVEDFEDFGVDFSLPLSQSTEYSELLPSAHVKFDVTGNDRLSFSLARTVRRPKFNDLAPIFLDGELGDNDFYGNAALDQEKAWGWDAGYERRLGRSGVFGVNLFYRDVSDLIEVYNTGVPSLDTLENNDDDGFQPGDAGFDAESFVFSVRNTGDAIVRGIEFDVSTPLAFIGLPNTGVFSNYAWLDSEVEDEVGTRRINGQAEYVFNAGFIHDLPSLGASFGMSYRAQGDAVERVVAEEVLIQYGPNLEAFVEKRFGKRFVVRLTGTNLLDESKDERFLKYDNLADQLSGQTDDLDEYELETEEAGPVFQLIGRVAF